MTRKIFYVLSVELTALFGEHHYIQSVQYIESPKLFHYLATEYLGALGARCFEIFTRPKLAVRVIISMKLMMFDDAVLINEYSFPF